MRRPLAFDRLRVRGNRHAADLTLDAQLSGLKKLFMGGMVQKSMDGEMGSLDTLKRVFEGQGS